MFRILTLNEFLTNLSTHTIGFSIFYVLFLLCTTFIVYTIKSELTYYIYGVKSYLATKKELSRLKSIIGLKNYLIRKLTKEILIFTMVDYKDIVDLDLRKTYLILRYLKYKESQINNKEDINSLIQFKEHLQNQCDYQFYSSTLNQLNETKYLFRSK